MLGLLNELVGNPFARTFKGKPELAAEIEQSVLAGFADAAVQGVANTCEEKNGGLNPGLGFEKGPFSCPP